MELQTGEPHLCAWEDHGKDLPGSNVKACVRQEGDLKEPAWLQQRQIVPDTSGGFI